MEWIINIMVAGMIWNKHPWFFEFHGVYRDQICDVINSGRQYLKHPIKEITDRKTHKKEYLHSF